VNDIAKPPLDISPAGGSAFPFEEVLEGAGLKISPSRRGRRRQQLPRPPWSVGAPGRLQGRSDTGCRA